MGGRLFWHCGKCGLIRASNDGFCRSQICSPLLSSDFHTNSTDVQIEKLKEELKAERELANLAMTDIVNIYHMEELHPIFQDDAVRFEKELKKRGIDLDKE